MKFPTVVLCFGMFFCFRSAVQAQPLQIQQITDSIYVYTTFKPVNGRLFPSNSLYAVTTSGIVMIDTPWDTTQTKPLLDSIQSRHHQAVAMCLVTHFHDDRTAGLDILKRNGVETYSTVSTYNLCVANHEYHAAHKILNDTTFTTGNTTFDTYFPGEGHTPDNIVVWFPKQRVLFGGCLVKSVEAKGLGNTADANLSTWPSAIRNVLKKYRAARIVVPGHQSWGSGKSLRHTLKLLKSHKRTATD